MPVVTHEPSGLIAIRALEELERERRAAEAAREAAVAEARAREEAAAREAAEARLRAEQEAAEQARRAEEARRHDERMRALEIEASVRAAQAAHLARVQAELDASIAAASRKAGARIGLATAAALGVVGLVLALLFQTTGAPSPAPALVPASPGGFDDVKAFIAEQHRENARLLDELAGQHEALEATQAEPAPEPTLARPPARPTARPAPRPKPPARTHDLIKTCETDDPLAEDC